MIGRVRKFGLAVALAGMLGVLAGCETPVDTQTFPKMTFGHLPPIQLLVADIQIESNAPQSTDPPNIAHLFPVSPHEALEQWAKDRLKIAGARGTARFTIVRAEAVGTQIQIDKGFTGLFKAELSDRYEARVDAVLTIFDSSGRRLAHVEAKAEQVATIREDSTLVERRRQMYDMTEKLMATFNAEMERQIPRFLSDHAL